MMTDFLPTKAEPHRVVPVEPVARCQFGPHLLCAVRSPRDSGTTAQRRAVLTGAPRPGTGIQWTILASTSRTDCGTERRSLGTKKPHPLLWVCLSERAGRAKSHDGPDFGGNRWNDPHRATAAATRPQREIRQLTQTLLPKPIGRQKEVLYLPARGHAVVLGTAGSGKTTLAILRSLYLSDPSTSHGGRTLLVTFNRCLVTYMRNLAAGIRKPIDVRNYHHFARGYLKSRNKLPWNSICGPADRLSFIEAALDSEGAVGIQNTILHRPREFFDEEFKWIQGHGIGNLQDYVEVKRTGRSSGLKKAHRPILFDVYKRYLRLRKQGGKLYDWEDLASAVLSELRKDRRDRLYRHVVIDEGQDFSPEMLRSLADAIPSDGSLTFLGDIAQQIYGHRTSWRSAGLKPRQVWEFKDNYRNTRQIARLALSLAEMPHFPDDPDLVEPRAPTADGPLPALVRRSSEAQERELVVSEGKNRAQTGTVAILLRTGRQVSKLEQHLPEGATRLHRDLSVWPNGPGLFYGTYHASKGLEFDTVLLPFLSDRNWPHRRDINVLGQTEAEIRDSRLLYVGITRARTDLILTYSGEPTALLPPNVNLYQS